MGRLPMALLEYFADSLYAERNVGVIRSFCDAVGLSDHYVTGLQGDPSFADKAGDILLQPERKSQVESVVSFQVAIAADDQDFLMLPTDGHNLVPVAKQAQSEIAIAAHALNAFVDDAIENVQQLFALVRFTRQQSSDSGLHHNGDDTAFQAVTGDITDYADHVPVLAVDDVVVVAADFGRRLHGARNVEAGDLAHVFLAGQHHLLKTLRDL